MDAQNVGLPKLVDHVNFAADVGSMKLIHCFGGDEVLVYTTKVKKPNFN